MLKSLVGGPRCFGGLQLLCWGTSQVGVRAVSPLGDAQVQGTSHESRTFSVVHACSARQVGFWYAVLVWCQQLCFPVSLHVSLLDSELACFGLPVLLVLRAAPSVTATLLGRPSIFRSFSSAICPLAISSGDGLLVLRLCPTSSPPEGFRRSRYLFIALQSPHRMVVRLPTIRDRLPR